MDFASKKNMGNGKEITKSYFYNSKGECSYGR